MDILFIGGTGNISTDCAALLQHGGHSISVVTRGHVPIPAAYRSIKADRKDAGAMRAALQDTTLDVVINFLGYGLADVELDFDLFVGKIRQYIFISTAMVYAKPHRHLPLTEDSPKGNPYSEYAKQKLAMEEWLVAHHTESDLPVTIVRPSHTYSCRWFPNVVASAGYTFAARLEQGRPVFVVNDGTSLWTLTQSADFAIGLAGLVGNEAAIGEAFHITSDEALPWNRIYTETATALGVEKPVVEKIPVDFLCEKFPDLSGGIKGDKAEPAVFDNSKLKRFVPDFACRKSFAVGIRESVAWYTAHPAEKKINPKTDALFDGVIAAWREASGCRTGL